MAARIGWVGVALTVQIGVAAMLVGWKVASLWLLGAEGRFDSPFFHAMATGDWQLAVPGAALLVVGFLMVGHCRDVVDRLADIAADHVPHIAAVVVLLLLVGTRLVYLWYPLSMDEYAATFQAEVFAAGQVAGRWPTWAAPLLVSPRFAKGIFLLCNYDTGRVVSTYWPGHAALLAPFSRVGADWALNPLLAGAAILLVASLARRLGGPRAAGYAVVFTVASPVFHAYGLSYYSMMSHLVANLAYARLLIVPTPLRAAAAGCIGGLALGLHNPFPHALFGGTWIVWLLTTRRWASALIVAACSLAVFLPIDSGWQRVKDSVRMPAGDAPADGADAQPRNEGAMGGVAVRVIGYVRWLRIPDISGMVARRLYALCREVAWDTPGLVVLAAAAAAGAGCRGGPPLAAAALVTFLGYAFSPWDGGHGWGSRYMVSAWGVLPVMAGVAIASRSDGVRRVARACGIAAWGSMAVCVPLAMGLVRGQITETLDTGPRDLIAQHAEAADRLWVFLGESERVTQDFIRNDPFLRHGPFILFGQDAERNAANIRFFASQLDAVPRPCGGDFRGTAWMLDPLLP
jgi:hypothetical protein